MNNSRTRTGTSGVSKRLYLVITWSFALGSIFIIMQFASYLILNYSSEPEIIHLSRKQFKQAEDVVYENIPLTANQRFQRAHDERKRYLNVEIDKKVNINKNKGKHQHNAEAVELEMERKKMVYKNRWQRQTVFETNKTILTFKKNPKKITKLHFYRAKGQDSLLKHVNEDKTFVLKKNKAEAIFAARRSNYSGLVALHGRFVYYNRQPEASKRHQYVLGVLPRYQHKYVPDSKHKFQCLHSKELIEFSFVNDDFCDCVDGSDEPGTAACPDAKFYCSVQVKGSEQWILSSRVRDGVCDCCDGSDEVQLGQALKEHGLYPFSGRCVDTCDKQREQLAVVDKQRRRGSELRQQYVVHAQQKRLVGVKQVYGVDGGWAKLEDECLEKQQGQYVYTLCFFSEIKQRSLEGEKATFLIGKDPRWAADGTGANYLLWERGDGAGCPAGDRTSRVYFTCADHNALLSAQEIDPCQYRLDAVSPAACS